MGTEAQLLRWAGYFLSFDIFFAISAINLGFKSARTLSTMLEISLVSSAVAGDASKGE